MTDDLEPVVENVVEDGDEIDGSPENADLPAGVPDGDVEKGEPA